MQIRRAVPSDAPVIAHHRVSMFLDMGSGLESLKAELAAKTVAYLREAMPRGEYFGWLAAPADEPGRIVAGAGVQLRRVLPFQRRFKDGRAEVSHGNQGIVVNVYTEADHRRRGIARALMSEILRWARDTRLESLVLHAAPDGRPLYESMGFAQTNEMRFMGDL